MHAEHITKLLHGVRELLQALPPAGLFAGGQIIRVLVVVSGLPPAVQMQVELVHAQSLQALHPFGPVGERHQPVVFFRIFFVIIGGAFRHMALALHMHDAATDELFHIGVLGGLLL